MYMKPTCKRLVSVCLLIPLLIGCGGKQKSVTLSKEVLMDKIKGGWAGQTFGCTFGGPTEFRYNGRIIEDSVEIQWPEHYHLWWFQNSSSLYDDIYMDLTFVDMFDKYGLDVPVDTIAQAFAHASYKLWHANQAARSNILKGLPVPACGHWKNNPHADDIDFQIEADFAGLMAPGMPNSAAEVCDRIGHIMCYGDGWYGGVYVAAMYSLAFVSDDIEQVVTEALKVIPPQSDYYKCIDEVIGWCKSNPDWKTTWQLVQEKWTDEISCPKGTKNPYTIDAKVNSAYVVMGLMYGAKDMEKTLQISTRCGADSDCNPATAAGILGTMLGYSNIDKKWIDDLREVEDMNFDHTEISLNKAYELSLDQALEMVVRGGGKVSDTEVTIALQTPKAVRYEKSFDGMELIAKDTYPNHSLRKPVSYEFEGTGFVCSGRVRPGKECPRNYVAQIEIDIDGRKEIVNMPADFITRQVDIYWNYDLPLAEHTVNIRWINPIETANVTMDAILTYTTQL